MVAGRAATEQHDGEHRRHHGEEQVPGHPQPFAPHQGDHPVRHGPQADHDAFHAARVGRQECGRASHCEGRLRGPGGDGAVPRRGVRRRPGQGRAHRHRAGDPGQVPREHPERATPGRPGAQPARRRRRLLAGQGPGRHQHRRHHPRRRGPAGHRSWRAGRATRLRRRHRCPAGHVGRGAGQPALGARAGHPGRRHRQEAARRTCRHSSTTRPAGSDRPFLARRRSVADRRSSAGPGLTSPGRPTPGGGGPRCRSWCRRRGPASRWCRRRAGRTAGGRSTR